MTRLRHIKRGDLTILRIRRGRGFGYVDPDGVAIRDDEAVQRIRVLAIPPAWTEVRIAADPVAHIQASGLDAAGRVQYIYHPEWVRRREKHKGKQLELLTAALPRIRRHVREDLGAETGSKLLALAIGVAVIDRTAMRVGRERYLSTHGTRGAGTLFTRDVSVHGENVRMKFPAKSGKTAEYSLHDPALADAITRVKTIPGSRLLMYRDAQGTPKAIRSEDLVAYLREIAGTRVTPKDFRTLHASALAGEALSKLEPGESPSARKRQMAAVTREVANFLRNTPAICRASYIAPCLFELFEKGRLTTLWASEDRSAAGLRQREARLATLLAAVG